MDGWISAIKRLKYIPNTYTVLTGIYQKLESHISALEQNRNTKPARLDKISA